MVEKYPFRVLTSFTYDGEETPLRSDRIAERPPMSDIASDLESVASDPKVVKAPFIDVSGIPNHNEFIQMIINAKATADITNSAIMVQWRGYSTYIHPGFKLSKDSLQKEILDALQRLEDVSEIEKKVL